MALLLAIEQCESQPRLLKRQQKTTASSPPTIQASKAASGRNEPRNRIPDIERLINWAPHCDRFCHTYSQGGMRAEKRRAVTPLIQDASCTDVKFVSRLFDNFLRQDIAYLMKSMDSPKYELSLVPPVEQLDRPKRHRQDLEDKAAITVPVQSRDATDESCGGPVIGAIDAAVTRQRKARRMCGAFNLQMDEGVRGAEKNLLQTLNELRLLRAQVARRKKRVLSEPHLLELTTRDLDDERSRQLLQTKKAAFLTKTDAGSNQLNEMKKLLDDLQKENSALKREISILLKKKIDLEFRNYQAEITAGNLMKQKAVIPILSSEEEKRAMKESLRNEIYTQLEKQQNENLSAELGLLKEAMDQDKESLLQEVENEKRVIQLDKTTLEKGQVALQELQTKLSLQVLQLDIERRQLELDKKKLTDDAHQLQLDKAEVQRQRKSADQLEKEHTAHKENINKETGHLEDDVSVHAQVVGKDEQVAKLRGELDEAKTEVESLKVLWKGEKDEMLVELEDSRRLIASLHAAGTEAEAGKTLLQAEWRHVESLAEERAAFIEELTAKVDKVEAENFNLKQEIDAVRCRVERPHPPLANVTAEETLMFRRREQFLEEELTKTRQKLYKVEADLAQHSEAQRDILEPFDVIRSGTRSETSDIANTDDVTRQQIQDIARLRHALGAQEHEVITLMSELKTAERERSKSKEKFDTMAAQLLHSQKMATMFMKSRHVAHQSEESPASWRRTLESSGDVSRRNGTLNGTESSDRSQSIQCVDSFQQGFDATSGLDKKITQEAPFAVSREIQPPMTDGMKNPRAPQPFINETSEISDETKEFDVGRTSSTPTRSIKRSGTGFIGTVLASPLLPQPPVPAGFARIKQELIDVNKSQLKSRSSEHTIDSRKVEVKQLLPPKVGMTIVNPPPPPPASSLRSKQRLGTGYVNDSVNLVFEARGVPPLAEKEEEEEEEAEQEPLPPQKEWKKAFAGNVKFSKEDMMKKKLVVKKKPGEPAVPPPNPRKLPTTVRDLFPIYENIEMNYLATDSPSRAKLFKSLVKQLQEAQKSIERISSEHHALSQKDEAHRTITEDRDRANERLQDMHTRCRHLEAENVKLNEKCRLLAAIIAEISTHAEALQSMLLSDSVRKEVEKILFLTESRETHRVCAYRSSSFASKVQQSSSIEEIVRQLSSAAPPQLSAALASSSPRSTSPGSPRPVRQAASVKSSPSLSRKQSLNLPVARWSSELLFSSAGAGEAESESSATQSEPLPLSPRRSAVLRHEFAPIFPLKARRKSPGKMMIKKLSSSA